MMGAYGKYGTTVENCNMAKEKAKSKRDGIYKLPGLFYVVKDGRVPFVAAHGDVFCFAGHFIVLIGRYEHTQDTAKNKREILKITNRQVG